MEISGQRLENSKIGKNCFEIYTSRLTSPGTLYLRFQLLNSEEFRVVVNKSPHTTRGTNSECICVVVRRENHQAGTVLALTNPEKANTSCFPDCNRVKTAQLSAKAQARYFLLIDCAYEGGTAVVGSVTDHVHRIHLYAIRIGSWLAQLQHVGFAGYGNPVEVKIEEQKSGVSITRDELLQWNALRYCAVPVGSVIENYSPVQLSDAVSVVGHTDSLPGIKSAEAAIPKKAVPYSYQIVTKTDVTIFIVSCHGLDKWINSSIVHKDGLVITFGGYQPGQHKIVMLNKAGRAIEIDGAALSFERWYKNAQLGLPSYPNYEGKWSSITVFTHLNEPRLHLRVEHFHRNRIASHYSHSTPESLQRQAGAALAYTFATREILKLTGWHFCLPPQNGRANLMGFEVNNPHHGDSPAHFHIAVDLVDMPHFKFVDDTIRLKDDRANLVSFLVKTGTGGVELTSAFDSRHCFFLAAQPGALNDNASVVTGCVVVVDANGEHVFSLNAQDDTSAGRLCINITSSHSLVPNVQEIIQYDPLTGKTNDHRRSEELE